MKKQLLVVLVLVMTGILIFSPNTTNATPYYFSAIAAGGTGSATMDFSISGTTLIVTIDNISPTLLEDLSGPNAPGITGFGFDLDPDILAMIGDWTLEAYTTENNSVEIGPTGTNEWVMGTSIGGISLDYLPNTFGGISGALFNPSATEGLPGGSNNVYYTTATLTMNFNIAPILVDEGDSPFLRMQNVGENGGGSLKTTGTSVPDAHVMLLLGSSLMGLAVFSRKSKRTG
jgi:hypothetical protein